MGLNSVHVVYQLIVTRSTLIQGCWTVADFFYPCEDFSVLFIKLLHIYKRKTLYRWIFHVIALIFYFFLQELCSNFQVNFVSHSGVPSKLGVWWRKSKVWRKRFLWVSLCREHLPRSSPHSPIVLSLYVHLGISLFFSLPLSLSHGALFLRYIDSLIWASFALII